MQVPSTLDPYFRALAWLGVVLVIGDLWLSAKFGYSIGWDMMVIVGAVSLASGILPVVGVYFARAGFRPLAGIVGATWVVAFAFNCWSNMGVSTANRMGDVQAARVQQTTYDGRQKKIGESEASLALFEKRLGDLENQNGWVAAVTADSLRAKLASSNLAIEQEASRGGCKAKCLERTKERDELAAQIAIAERRADYTKQIEATKKVLADLRAELASTKSGISATANQSSLYAKLIAWNLSASPDENMVMVANEATGVATAVVLALIAAAVTLSGAWPHLMAVRPMGDAAGSRPHAKLPRMPPASAAAAEAAPASVPPPAIHTREIVTSDQHVWGELRDALRRADTLRCA